MHEFWVREIATGTRRKAGIFPRGGWAKCDHPDHDPKKRVAPDTPRLWVEHPDGRVTQGSRGKPPRLFYDITHGWQLYERVADEAAEPETWDCLYCDNDLNNGAPFRVTKDSKLAEKRMCGLCNIHGPKTEWPADLSYRLENR
jgi:hypothetical protein